MRFSLCKIFNAIVAVQMQCHVQRFRMKAANWCIFKSELCRKELLSELTTNGLYHEIFIRLEHLLKQVQNLSHWVGQVQSDFVRAIQLLTVGSLLQAWAQADLSSPLASPPSQPPPSPTSSPPPSPPCWRPPSGSCQPPSGRQTGFLGFWSLHETHDFLLAAPCNVSHEGIQL